VQDPVDGQLGHHEVAGDAREVEQQRLPVEAALPGLGELVFDGVEVAVVDVDAPAVDGEPGPSVEDAAAPVADLGDLAVPADRPQAGGVEGTSVVHSQVPVAVGRMGALGA
jgi:hypothetical protein